MVHWLAHWFQFNYAPPGQPFYDGATWPNVFVILIVAPLGWFWSRTKFWPLKPLKHAIRELHEKVDAHHETTGKLYEHISALHARHEEHADAITALHGLVAELHRKLLDGRPED